MKNIIDLTDLAALRAATNGLSAEQLETARGWVQVLIEARTQLQREKLEERKHKQMRSLVSKAGISWDEFQDALK